MPKVRICLRPCGADGVAVLKGRGKIIHSDNEIIFDKVPIVTPNGTSFSALATSHN